jgi:hypothetical protein
LIDEIDFFILLAETKENNEVKTSAQENEPEAGEVPDAPRALHRTLSIFFRHLAMQTTKEDLENVEIYHFQKIETFSLKII